MSESGEIEHSLIVPPQFDNLVLASGDEMLAFLGDGECVDFAFVGALEHADGLSVKGGPVGDFPVGASGEELTLLGMVKHLLEEGGFEQAHDPGEALEVPDDATAVGGGGDCLVVVPPDLDRPDSASVFLERGLHDLGLLPDFPHPHFSFVPSGDDLLAVSGRGDGGHSVDVRVVDHVHQFPRLRVKGPDLPVIPPAQNRLSVTHKRHAVAL